MKELYAQYRELAAELNKARGWAQERNKPRLAALLGRASAAVSEIPDLAEARLDALREREALRRLFARQSDALMVPGSELLDRLHELWGWDRGQIHRVLTEVAAWCREQDDPHASETAPDTD